MPALEGNWQFASFFLGFYLLRMISWYSTVLTVRSYETREKTCQEAAIIGAESHSEFKAGRDLLYPMVLLVPSG